MSPKNNNKQVSAAVRILQQKRDASARATHLMVKNDSLITYEKAASDQADKGKFPESTFLERKIMSTKTSFKRIALVAASALAIAGFSAVPANAVTNTYMWCEVADGLANGTATDDVCNGVAGVANTVTLTFENAPANSRVVVAGPGATIGTTSDADLVIATNGLSATYSATAANNDGLVTINTPSVGTVTVSLFETAAAGIYKATATETVTITVNAAALAGGINASTSTAVMNKAATWSSTTEATSTSASATANTSGTPVFAVKVSLGQVAGAITTTTKVAVSLAGPGTLSLSASDTDPADSAIATGRSLTSTVNSTGEVFTVGIAPDGTAGVATLTITAGTYTATKTVTFVGAVTSLSFTKVSGVISDLADGVLTGDTNAYAAVVTGKDAAGNAVTLVAGDFTAPTAAAITAAGITSAAVVAATAGTYSGVEVAASAPVLIIDPTATKTGAKSLTLTHTASTLTVAVPFTVGLDKATTVTLSLDKTSYTPGEKMILTVTAKGSDGIAIADISAATGLFATGGITSSLALQGDTTTATDPALVDGKKSYTLYAPLAAGPLTFNATTGAAGTYIATAGAAAAITTTADVEGDATASLALDAANAATDAANNAYDEAQNATQAASDALAAVTALAKQVKSLIASVKKLTAAVAKLR
jgi:trimeric autotransporter adhesin